ncbi:sensor histidine kinase [Gracilibacillus alcaliphilus]|uniref:sensor histidine kinase n=1 Tax=Gracilibacillus alcaliphilus TaxID=1401441 RepID=UPI00195ADAC4|nr:sensor histidine kinase [Gracilibacillus alcaliphilus]MBM7675624.1 sensor histidine kinase YesM [Gracilibacillus alcaliphilus]
MKNSFRALSIKSKIFITFASVYIIVITVIGTLIYFMNINQMKDNAQEMSIVLSAQMTQTIDLYFRDIERMAISIFTDTDVQEALVNYKNSTQVASDVVIRNQLYGNIFNQSYPREDVEGVTLYTPAGVNFSYYKSDGTRIGYEPAEEIWMKEIGESNDFLLLPTHREIMPNGNEKLVISFIRNIYEIPVRDRIGTLKIDINVDVFKELLEIENVDVLEEHLRVLILTDEGHVVYDDKQALTGEKLRQLPMTADKSGTLEWEETAYLFADDQSEFTGWHALTLINNDFVVHERNQVILFIGISGAAAILIIAGISYLLSHNITKPFVNMMRNMKRVEQGDLAERMELSSNEEVNVSIRVYNSMLDSIHKLITEVYESSITEKNAKISALQSQINPHFLYNTLNIMKSISRVKGVEEVAEISESLADLFKYTMRGLGQHVYLEEEMVHIHNYIRIQQYRFRDRFIVSEYITDEVKKVFIPKLLLQPIIENAVNHGLGGKKREGIIEIYAYKEGDYLFVRIADNGQGMSEMKLEQLQQQLKKNIVEAEGGVGLHNIAQRLRLVYGHRANLSIYSEEGVGTTVEMYLPLEKKKGEGE